MRNFVIVLCVFRPQRQLLMNGRLLVQKHYCVPQNFSSSTNSVFTIFSNTSPVYFNMTCGLGLPSLPLYRITTIKVLLRNISKGFPFPLSELIAKKWSYRFMPKDNGAKEKDYYDVPLFICRVKILNNRIQQALSIFFKYLFHSQKLSSVSSIFFREKVYKVFQCLIHLIRIMLPK